MMAASPFQNLAPRLVGLSALIALCSFASTASAQNLISNGTFDEDISPWWTHATEPVMQMAEVVEGRMCSTITGGVTAEQADADDTLQQTQTWDVILGYSGLPLSLEQYYRISFSASSPTGRTMRYKVGLGEAPYTDYFIQTIQITSEPQTFEVIFRNLRENPEAQFQFHIGGGDGSICLDDVVVEPIAAPVAVPFVTQSATGTPLKSHSQTIMMGTAVDTPIFLSNPQHNAIVAGEFSMITPANSMKMNIIQPTQGVWDFTETDALLTWAETNGLQFRGHPLVWHTQTPGWLTETEFSRDEMIDFMYQHIDQLMQRYIGRITYWDVVNEAIEPAHNYGGVNFRETIWSTRIGTDFVDLAFTRANQNDPNAKLLYNDYNASPANDSKGDAVYALIESMVTRGIPIHAVGLQNHWFVREDATIGANYNLQAFKDNMARYDAIGIEVHLTEMDVRIQGGPTQAQIDAQTAVYGEVLQACIEAPNCTNLTVWGLSDVDSWVPSTFPGEGYAHLYDENFMAKAGYQTMNQVLEAYPSDAELAMPEPTTSEGSGGCSHAPARTTRPSHWLLILLMAGAVWSRAKGRRSHRATGHS